jgi:PilX N-terminal
MYPRHVLPEGRLAMKPQSRAARSQQGFALILALLSLVVLTLLGLTLATTTSTELQIASNYRWSKQAYYNAEAGVEAAVALLSTTGLDDFGDMSTAPPGVLDVARTTSWAMSTLQMPTGPLPSGMDYYPVTAIPGCDERGGGVGYGRVVQIGATRLEEQSTVFGAQGLPGTFTAWVRREVRMNAADGRFLDNDKNTVAVLTVMGTAPKTAPLSAFDRTRQATRVIEVVIGKASGTTTCRGTLPASGQVGRGPLNANYAKCVELGEGGVAVLGGLFDQTARGTLAKQ